MVDEMIVEPIHFSYLRVQKGRLSNLSGRFDVWLSNYRSSIENDLFTILPFLPRGCSSVLDVGSGLGGIDAAINHQLGGELSVTLLDGEKDEPVVTLHRDTFNNMEVAMDFLIKNGVKSVSWLSPDMVDGIASSKKYDLIISLGSWCFHYPPSYYLDFVKSASKRGTVLILDVRAGKKAWEQDLSSSFEHIADAWLSEKWSRKVYRAR